MARIIGYAAIIVLALALAACANEAADPAAVDTAPTAVAEESTPEAIEEEATPEAVENEPTSVQLALQDDMFAPQTLELTAGSEVTVEVTNDGNNPHTFTIPSLDVDTGTLQPGDSTQVTFTAPGHETEFRCVIHSSMTGTISPSA